VSMRYGEESHLVLDRADLELVPGEHVALVGPSGIGKTTLAELRVRFLDPAFFSPDARRRLRRSKLHGICTSRRWFRDPVPDDMQA